MWYNKRHRDAGKIIDLSKKNISKGGNYGTDLELKNHASLTASSRNFLVLFQEKSNLLKKNDLLILPEITNLPSANSLLSYSHLLPAAKVKELK